MHSLVLRLEAIESRLSSYTCPRRSNRVHSLHLRRCFRSIPRAAAALAKAQTPSQYHDSYDASVESYRHLSKDHPSSPDTVHNVKELSQDKPIVLASLREQIPRHGLLRYHGIRKAIVVDDMIPHTPRKAPAEIIEEEQAKLYNGLRVGNPHAVMRSLMNIVQLETHGYPSSILVSAAPPVFSEILRCIDPKYFLDQYTSVFREIGSRSTNLVGGGQILGDEDYYEFCTAFLKQAGQIMNARRRRWPLFLSDYKYLLKCARAVGHAKAAEVIWKDMQMPGYNTVQAIPDVEAFNHFLAVKCWQDRMIPKHRHRLRVIEENFTPRSWLIPPHTLSSHRVGPDRGIKAQASALFRQMVEIGVTGNEETFCLMMIALGREGDLNGIASILSRVWNIDVDAIMNDEPGIKPPTAYSPRSPFFPSSHLLYSIAHAYGSNNEISTALRLLDYVSRHYSIKISLNVWNELLQWTSIVSINKHLVRKRADEAKPTGREAGQLPPEAVSNLWQTMVSEPYNVKPTIQMFDRLISNLAYRQRFGEIQIRMEEARRVLKAEILELGRKEAAYLAIREQRNKSLIETKARELIYARFRVWRNRQYVKRWVRLLLRRGSRSLRRQDTFTAQDIPNIVQSWIVFMPKQVRYKTATGEVSFWSASHALNRWRAGMLGRRARWESKNIALWKETEDSQSEDGVENENSE